MNGRGTLKALAALASAAPLASEALVLPFGYAPRNQSGIVPETAIIKNGG